MKQIYSLCALLLLATMAAAQCPPISGIIADSKTHSLYVEGSPGGYCFHPKCGGLPISEVFEVQPSSAPGKCYRVDLSGFDRGGNVMFLAPGCDSLLHQTCILPGSLSVPVTAAQSFFIVVSMPEPDTISLRIQEGSNCPSMPPVGCNILSVNNPDFASGPDQYYDINGRRVSNLVGRRGLFFSKSGRKIFIPPDQ